MKRLTLFFFAICLTTTPLMSSPLESSIHHIQDEINSMADFIDPETNDVLLRFTEQLNDISLSDSEAEASYAVAVAGAVGAVVGAKMVDFLAGDRHFVENEGSVATQVTFVAPRVSVTMNVKGEELGQNTYTHNNSPEDMSDYLKGKRSELINKFDSLIVKNSIKNEGVNNTAAAAAAGFIAGAVSKGVEIGFEYAGGKATPTNYAKLPLDHFDLNKF